jgi:hypothetical protein
MIRSGLGLGFGVVFSVLLFKRRAWPAFVGLGFGAGRAWEECDNVSPLQHLAKSRGSANQDAVVQAGSSTPKRWPPRRQAMSASRV